MMLRIALLVLAVACGDSRPTAGTSPTDADPTIPDEAAEPSESTSPRDRLHRAGIAVTTPANAECKDQVRAVPADYDRTSMVLGGFAARPSETWQLIQCGDADGNLFVAGWLDRGIDDPAARVASDLEVLPMINGAGDAVSQGGKLSYAQATVEVQEVDFIGNPLTRHLRYLSTDDHFFYAAALGPGLTAEQADAWLDTVSFDALDD